MPPHSENYNSSPVTDKKFLRAFGERIRGERARRGMSRKLLADHAVRRKYVRIKRDPKRFEYTDIALTPVNDHDVEDLELFHTPAAEAYMAREQRVRELSSSHA